jgi:hypothetical protein
MSFKNAGKEKLWNHVTSRGENPLAFFIWFVRLSLLDENLQFEIIYGELATC